MVSGFQEAVGCHSISGNIFFTVVIPPFCQQSAWPVLKGAAQFYADFLVPDPKTGWLVSCPSNSPENGGLVSGPTMDHEIIKSLFKICIEASEILNRDMSFADTLKQILPKIAPYKIGQIRTVAGVDG